MIDEPTLNTSAAICIYGQPVLMQAAWPPPNWRLNLAKQYLALHEPNSESKPVAASLFCGHDVLDAIKDASKPAERPVDTILGFRIFLVEDHQQRRAEAFALSATTNRPVLYEDDQGNIIEVNMSKYEFSPFAKLPPQKFP